MAAASAAYIGDNLSFKHQGGVASFYLNPPPPNGSAVSLNGGVRLCVQLAKCFENPSNVTSGSNVTISDLLSSYVRASHAEFYERGWRIGNACAAHTSVFGTQFIVVYRSLGTDTSCGGGEYSTTPFIKYFQDNLDEHVAIAWPTIDGDGFFGLPRDDGRLRIKLVYDKDLSDIIVNNINNDVIFKKIGDPKSVIKKVVVPILDQTNLTSGGPDPSVSPDYELVKAPGIMWSFNTSINAKMIDSGAILPQNKYPVTSLYPDSDIEIASGSLSSRGIEIRALSGTLPTRMRAISFWFNAVNAQSSFSITIGSVLSGIFKYALLVKVYDYVGLNVRQVEILSYTNQDNAVEGSTDYAKITIPNNAWVHIVANRVSDQYVEIYVNGVKNGIIGPLNDESSWVNQSTVSDVINSTAGSLLDQVRLYNDTMTVDMISALYRIGRNAN
jgi:hypothetical protein